MRIRALIVVLAAVAVGGCGSDPTLSSSSARELKAQVAAVREAASEQDRAAALEALAMASNATDLSAARMAAYKAFAHEEDAYSVGGAVSSEVVRRAKE